MPVPARPRVLMYAFSECDCGPSFYLFFVASSLKLVLCSFVTAFLLSRHQCYVTEDSMHFQRFRLQAFVK